MDSLDRTPIFAACTILGVMVAVVVGLSVANGDIGAPWDRENLAVKMADRASTIALSTFTEGRDLGCFYSAPIGVTICSDDVMEENRIITSNGYVDAANAADKHAIKRLHARIEQDIKRRNNIAVTTDLKTLFSQTMNAKGGDFGGAGAGCW